MEELYVGGKQLRWVGVICVPDVTVDTSGGWVQAECLLDDKGHRYAGKSIRAFEGR